MLDLREHERMFVGMVATQMAKLKYHKKKPYFSTLTGRYYPSYGAAFWDSLRQGGGAYNDFNLYLVHANGTSQIVFWTR